MERYNNNRYPMRRSCQGNAPGRYQAAPVRRVAQDCGCEGKMDGLAARRRLSPGRPSEDIDAFPLAMAYVPWQHWGDTYEMGRGMNIGTIFPELNKPFLCTRCAK